MAASLPQALTFNRPSRMRRGQNYPKSFGTDPPSFKLLDPVPPSTIRVRKWCIPVQWHGLGNTTFWEPIENFMDNAAFVYYVNDTYLQWSNQFIYWWLSVTAPAPRTLVLDGYVMLSDMFVVVKDIVQYNRCRVPVDLDITVGSGYTIDPVDMSIGTDIVYIPASAAEQCMDPSTNITVMYYESKILCDVVYRISKGTVKKIRVGQRPKANKYKNEINGVLCCDVLRKKANDTGIVFTFRRNPLLFQGTFHNEHLVHFDMSIREKEDDVYWYKPEQIEVKVTQHTIEIKSVTLKKVKALNALGEHDVEGRDLLDDNFQSTV
eukprot:13413_1